MVDKSIRMSQPGGTGTRAHRIVKGAPRPCMTLTMRSHAQSPDPTAHRPVSLERRHASRPIARLWSALRHRDGQLKTGATPDPADYCDENASLQKSESPQLRRQHQGRCCRHRLVRSRCKIGDLGAIGRVCEAPDGAVCPAVGTETAAGSSVRDHALPVLYPAKNLALKGPSRTDRPGPPVTQAEHGQSRFGTPR